MAHEIYAGERLNFGSSELHVGTGHHLTTMRPRSRRNSACHDAVTEICKGSQNRKYPFQSFSFLHCLSWSPKTMSFLVIFVLEYQTRHMEFFVHRLGICKKYRGMDPATVGSF